MSPHPPRVASTEGTEPGSMQRPGDPLSRDEQGAAREGTVGSALGAIFIRVVLRCGALLPPDDADVSLHVGNGVVELRSGSNRVSLPLAEGVVDAVAALRAALRLSPECAFAALPVEAGKPLRYTFAFADTQGVTLAEFRGIALYPFPLIPSMVLRDEYQAR